MTFHADFLIVIGNAISQCSFISEKKKKTFQIYFDKIYCIHPIKYSKNNNNIIFIIMPIMQAAYIPHILS